MVSREWRRADIAVLKEADVLTQVEAKAMYSFDLIRPGGRSAYLRQLFADAVKMSALARSDRYLLSSVTDVRGEIPDDVRRYVAEALAGNAGWRIWSRPSVGPPLSPMSMAIGFGIST